MSRAGDVVAVIAKALATRPEDVQVDEYDRRGQNVIELSMAPGDLGRVIGRQGRTATALRTLATAAGELDGKRTVVDFPGRVTWDERILIGRIVRPQGNRGEVVVETATDFAEERFSPGAVLDVQRDGRIDTMTVTTSRPHDARWVVGFEGVATIDAAEALRGLELRMAPDRLKALDAGRHYVHDLAGCVVETEAGAVVGPVTDVRLDAGIPLLVIEGRAGEVLIPFTEAICKTVDVAGKLIVIAPPEGLLELNAKGSWRQRTSDSE